GELDLRDRAGHGLGDLRPDVERIDRQLALGFTLFADPTADIVLLEPARERQRATDRDRLELDEVLPRLAERGRGSGRAERQRRIELRQEAILGDRDVDRRGV